VVAPGLSPGDIGATLDNWQEPPYNRWAFAHIETLMPTHRVPRGPAPTTLEHRPLLRGDLPTVGFDGTPSTLDGVLDATFTDGVVVVHRGRSVFERFGGHTGPTTRHILMSVSKSVVGCVVGVLVDRGQLAPERFVTDYVPELRDSGYRGATVRHVLDMRSGVRFSEDYTNPDAEVRVIEEAALMRPRSHDGVPCSIPAFLTTLVADRPHGGDFVYRSCETDVLGWVCERAAGTAMPDLVAELLWGPIGAAHDAAFTCDGIGSVLHDGGMCATVGDLARFGTMLLDGGRVDGRQVVPEAWLIDGWAADDDLLAAFGRSPSSWHLRGGWYRNQLWFVPRPQGVVLLCLGINGQMLYVDAATGMVAAKVSSWPTAQAPAMLLDTLAAFDAAGRALASG
jgi:CubicO group peptidase (beta-lactamase class C family)